jgi:hypothetical protein
MLDLSTLDVDVNSFLSGFSGPIEPINLELVDMIVIERGQMLAQQFFDETATILKNDHPELLAFIQTALEQKLPFRVLWTPTIAILEQCIHQRVNNAATIERVAVSFAWDLVCSGFCGKWTSTLSGMNPLTIGKYVLPREKSFAVTSDSEQITVSYSGNKNWVYTRENQTVLAPNELMQAHGATYENVTFLVENLDGSQSYDNLADLALCASDLDKAASKHAAAVALLREYAPEYLEYVSRVIHTVIPLSDNNGVLNSGSSRDEPGVVHASVDCCPEAYAEMLVHEASHQYYYILRRLGDIEDGGDPTLYYSPVKQTGRPIAMILLAYHAFANVVLMGRRISQSGFVSPTNYFTQNEDFLMPILDTLKEGLTTTTALTQMGDRLWQPLDQELSVQS